MFAKIKKKITFLSDNSLFFDFLKIWTWSYLNLPFNDSISFFPLTFKQCLIIFFPTIRDIWEKWSEKGKKKIRHQYLIPIWRVFARTCVIASRVFHQRALQVDTHMHRYRHAAYFASRDSITLLIIIFFEL